MQSPNIKTSMHLIMKSGNLPVWQKTHTPPSLPYSTTCVLIITTAKVVARLKRRTYNKTVVEESKGDVQVDDKADVKAQQCKEPKKHNLQAKIAATRIRQAKTGNVRTYIQGQTLDTAKQWILIAEISQAQSPDHHALVQQVMYHVFVL